MRIFETASGFAIDDTKENEFEVYLNDDTVELEIGNWSDFGLQYTWACLDRERAEWLRDVLTGWLERQA